MKKYNIINNALGWLCFAIAAVTYLLTMEPSASFWDCPEFISQGAKLEVGHPPGNPIWMLTARFFINFAGGDMSMAALMVNAMSALLSAGTILLLFWTITHLVRRLIVKDDATEVSLTKMVVIFGAGLCGALAFTWSDTFWFSAGEGEVYAFSSFCTALVFWLVLKWENRADSLLSDRYLILIAYVIGVSIAVHLLNLLCIPAIGLVIYYRKFKNTNAKGSLIALGISCVVVGLILYGLVPGFVEMAQYFELLFVNNFGMSYNMGTLIYAILLIVLFIWAIYEIYCQKSIARIKISSCLSIIFSGMPFIGEGYLIPVLFIIALVGYCVFVSKLPIRILNIIITGIFVIFIGYSSYALLLIRANANPPMNQNAPDNVFALSSYLNREQYGERPLFRGAVFSDIIHYQEDSESGVPNIKYVPASAVLRNAQGEAVTTQGRAEYRKVIKTSPEEPDKYIVASHKMDYEEIPELKMLFPRIYSTTPSHVSGYKDWINYDVSKANIKDIQMYESGKGLVTKTVAIPTFADNLAYFINYQLNHMYWRYFMWNFAGRQNDIQGNGEVTQGNWISGIPFIDNARLGDQSLLPDEYGKGNKGHNVFYMLPLLFGIIGLLWQAFSSKRGIEQFWVIFFLFFMTGIAIVLYLNQTPGQPRERDYAFAGSFYAFAIWIGLAVPGIWEGIKSLIAKRKYKNAKIVEPTEQHEDKKTLAIAVVAAVLGLIVPIQMVSQTWDDHDRSGRYTARDFGMNYLSSVDKNGIIFVNGDNDTFPLWYAQEVEGYRTDVKVINMSYLTTDWYANQMQHPYYDGPAIDMYASYKDYGNDRMQYAYMVPTKNVATAKDALLELYSGVNERPNDYGDLRIISHANVYIPVDSNKVIESGIIPESQRDMINDVLYVELAKHLKSQGEPGMTLNKILALDMIAKSAENGWNRPIYFAVTVPSSYHIGLTPYLQQTGMAYQVTPAVVGDGKNHGINEEKMYDVITKQYRWGGLDKEDADLYLDETVRRMVNTTRSTMIDLAEKLYYEGLEDTLKANESFAKSREILKLMESKMPESVMQYENYTETTVADLYLKISEETGSTEDLQRAKEIAEKGLERYTKFIPYLSSLSDWQLKSIAYHEKYVLDIALPHCIALYKQTGGDLDKKLKELGVSIEDILYARYRFYQINYPYVEAHNFVNPMLQYYYILELDSIDVFYNFFERLGVNRQQLEYSAQVE
ncbi:MAG: DUF2723 domain-containing protein [Bacteroidales bacterium]|nr:DUF2723 domain-containing protein [Bacteroidales bacterium]